jgi:hypothetical protein
MIIKDLTENDPRTYAIIGASMEFTGSLAAAFSRRFIRRPWQLNSRNKIFRLDEKYVYQFITRTTARDSLLRRFHLL